MSEDSSTDILTFRFSTDEISRTIELGFKTHLCVASVNKYVSGEEMTELQASNANVTLLIRKERETILCIARSDIWTYAFIARSCTSKARIRLVPCVRWCSTWWTWRPMHSVGWKLL